MRNQVCNVLGLIWGEVDVSLLVRHDLYRFCCTPVSKSFSPTIKETDSDRLFVRRDYQGKERWEQECLLWSLAHQAERRTSCARGIISGQNGLQCPL